MESSQRSWRIGASLVGKGLMMQPDTYMNQNITKLKYRTSSKNSAPLIIRHPSAESGQITSIIRRGDSQKLQNLVSISAY